MTISTIFAGLRRLPENALGKYLHQHFWLLSAQSESGYLSYLGRKESISPIHLTHGYSESFQSTPLIQSTTTSSSQLADCGCPQHDQGYSPSPSPGRAPETRNWYLLNLPWASATTPSVPEGPPLPPLCSQAHATPASAPRPPRRGPPGCRATRAPSPAAGTHVRAVPELEPHLNTLDVDTRAHKLPPDQVGSAVSAGDGVHDFSLQTLLLFSHLHFSQGVGTGKGKNKTSYNLSKILSAKAQTNSHQPETGNQDPRRTKTGRGRCSSAPG